MVCYVSSIRLGRCENLTTLNGTTFTNITDITKYQTVVVFTYNSNRTAVAISNLPEQFRLKYAITNTVKSEVVANAQTQSTQVQDTMSELFGPQDSYNGSNLIECDSDLSDISNKVSDRGFQICLNTAGRVKLIRCAGTTPTDIQCETLMDFHKSEEDIINQVFKKFIEWDTIATTNNAEPFRKEIAGPETGLYSIGLYTFNWDFGRSYLTGDNCSAPIYRDDIIHFQNLLKRLPTIESNLMDRIRNQQNQKLLFN
jgi:hypothetical protein